MNMKTLKEFFKNVRNSIMISAILSIVFGVVLVVFPTIAADVVCILLGIGILISGIVAVVRYFSNESYAFTFRTDFISGLILCVAGLFILFRSDVVIALIPVLVGMILVIHGIVNLKEAFDLKKIAYTRWWGVLVGAAVTLVLGGLMIFNPFGTGVTMIVLIGVSLIVDGLSDLWALHCMKKLKNEVKKNIIEE